MHSNDDGIMITENSLCKVRSLNIDLHGTDTGLSILGWLLVYAINARSRW